MWFVYRRHTVYLRPSVGCDFRLLASPVSCLLVLPSRVVALCCFTLLSPLFVPGLMMLVDIHKSSFLSRTPVFEFCVFTRQTIILLGTFSSTSLMLWLTLQSQLFCVVTSTPFLTAPLIVLALPLVMFLIRVLWL